MVQVTIEFDIFFVISRRLFKINIQKNKEVSEYVLFVSLKFVFLRILMLYELKLTVFSLFFYLFSVLPIINQVPIIRFEIL